MGVPIPVYLWDATVFLRRLEEESERKKRRAFAFFLCVVVLAPCFHKKRCALSSAEARDILKNVACSCAMMSMEVAYHLG